MTETEQNKSTKTERTEFQFMAKPPRNSLFEPTPYKNKYKKHSQLNCTASDIETTDKKQVAVLFLRRDWRSSTSLQENSTDNGSYKTSVEEPYVSASRNYKNFTLWNENFNSLRTMNDKIDTENTLNEAKSEYSIFTICDVRKSHKNNNNNLSQATIDFEDSENYEECISNVSSTHLTCGQKYSSNFVQQMHKRHTTKNRETQTSFIINNDKPKTQSRNYDRAIKIGYGKGNMIYKNQLCEKIDDLSADIDGIDLEGEYMINSVNYFPPDINFSASQELKIPICHEIRKIPAVFELPHIVEHGVEQLKNYNLSMRANANKISNKREITPKQKIMNRKPPQSLQKNLLSNMHTRQKFSFKKD